MNILRSAVRNTAISLAGQVVTWTSTLLLTVAYGRFLGDVRFGELYFAISLVLLIGFPIESGFNQQITRDVAQEPDTVHAYVMHAISIKVVIWVFTYTLLLLTCSLLRYSAEVRSLIAICGCTLLSGSIGNVFAASHYAFGRVVFPVFGSILEKGLSAIIGFILLKSGASVQAMAYVLLGGSLTNTAWQAAWFLGLRGARFSPDPRILRRLITASVPFLAYGVLGVIYYRIDTVLLSLMTNMTVVGWYGAGYRLFDTLTFLPGLIITPIMLPLYSRLHATSLLSLRSAIEKTMNLLIITSLPVCTLLIAAAPAIVGFLYHRADYQHAIPVLQALSPGLFFLYINSLLTSVLISTGREKRIPIMAGAALVFNLALNLYLIPTYQHVGAAIVTSLTEFLLFCISVALLPSYLLPIKSLRVVVKALVAGAAMAAVVVLLRRHSILMILPPAIVIYLSIGLLLRFVPREDMRALYSAVRGGQ